MKIIIDAMGGDNAPGEIVRGTLDAVRDFSIEAVLVGDERAVRSIISEAGGDGLSGVSVVHAQTAVLMDDAASVVIKEKKDSSMAVAMRLLAEGGGDALVTAGSTGAALTGSTLYIKRVKGIRRAALAPVLPTKTGGCLLIDCGANVECTPEYLLQFALMGAFYAERAMGRKNARVGLLNIGTEETKGTAAHVGAYKLMSEAKSRGKLNFTGNVEARDVPFGAADVVVSDGFSGNILLKNMEGIGLFFTELMKDMFMKNAKTKLAALLVKDGLRDFKKLMDYTETGGCPLLGIAKPVIKAHGSSNAKAARGAIKQAIMYAEADIIGDIAAYVDELCDMFRTGDING